VSKSAKVVLEALVADWNFAMYNDSNWLSVSTRIKKPAQGLRGKRHFSRDHGRKILSALIASS
jgi:hypothetical protein